MEKEKTLKTIMETNLMPILVDDLHLLHTVLKTNDSGITEIDATKTLKELQLEESENEGLPKWYAGVLKNQNKKFNVLLIDNMHKIEEEEQMKFYELLKHRKVEDTVLPDNCIIVIANSYSSQLVLSETMYSLVMHV